MPDNTEDLGLRLTLARQQLLEAQARVTDLENQLEDIVSKNTDGKPNNPPPPPIDFEIGEKYPIEQALILQLEQAYNFQVALKALNEITIELTHIDDLNTFYRRTVELALQRLGFERFGFILYDSKTKMAQGTFGTDPQGNIIDEWHIRSALDPDLSSLDLMTRNEPTYLYEKVPLYHDERIVGIGWNATTVLINGTENLGWLVTDNLRTQTPPSTILMDILGLYGSTISNLLVQKRTQIALRESEARYHLMAEASTEGIQMVDANAHITYVNPTLQAFYGYAADEILGREYFDFIHPLMRESTRQRFEERKIGITGKRDVMVIHKDGTTRWALVSSAPLFSTDGIFQGILSLFTDIDQRKHTEEALKRALDKEKELGELKTRFVAMASHEFRTPLATLLALVETLSAYRGKLQEHQIEKRLTDMKDQINRLKDIMDNLLLLARMQAINPELEPVKLDINAFCQQIVDEFKVQPDVPNRLEYVSTAVLGEIEIDPHLIRQILSNLISNAIKYSPSATPVSVRLQADANTLVLTVHDQGIGIPEADLNRLFEPFHRASNIGTIPGTGLGLAITHESVELHGGTITVESQINVGSTFTVHIPFTN